jgi:polysaccharide pyruvyl transferase WcaK-like protein
MNNHILHIGIFHSSNYGDYLISRNLSLHLKQLNQHSSIIDFGLKTDLQPQNYSAATADKMNVWRLRLKKNKCFFLCYTWFKAKIEQLSHKKRVIALLKQTKTVFVGGGNLLNGLDLYFPTRIAFFIKQAQRYHCRIVIFSVGVGPFHFPMAKKMIQKACRGIPLIYVRDTYSKDQLAQIYQGQIIQVPDPAFIGESLSPFLSEKIEKPADVLLGINVMPLFHPIYFPDGSIDRYLTFIGFFAELIITISNHFPSIRFIFFSTEKRDYFALTDIFKKLPSSLPKTICNYQNCTELEQQMQHFSAIIGCRLHSLIIGQSHGIPAFGLSWQGKIAAFFSHYQLPECYWEVSDDLFNSQSLFIKIRDFLNNLPQIKDKLFAQKQQEHKKYVELLNKSIKLNS